MKTIDGNMQRSKESEVTHQRSLGYLKDKNVGENFSKTSSFDPIEVLTFELTTRTTIIYSIQQKYHLSGFLV